MNYQKKFFLYFAFVFLAFIAITISIQLDREKRFKTEELRSNLSLYADIVSDFLTQKEDTALILSLLPKDLRLTLITSNGDVLYDNVVKNDPPLENHLDRPEIIQAQQNGIGTSIRRSESNSSEYLYYVIKSSTGDYIRLAHPYHITFADFLQRENVLIYLLIFFLIATLIGMLFLTDKYGKVMTTLKRFVSEVEDGQPIDYKKINFPDTDSGIIGSKVISIYKQLEESKQQVNLAEERNRQLKQEMTNNIAHELKTPVSSIRGYLEILSQEQNMDPEKKKYFIERAYAQTIRLSDLINDIALITKLEEAGNLFIKENIKIRKIAEEAVVELNAHLDAAGIKVENQLEDTVIIHGNHNLIYSIFRNLIENSIHYAGEKVKISIECVKEDHDYYYFQYYDTGCGVKEEYLEKIFNRFVRIDEGRNRKTGGTGLGLSIVKHAVLFHQGNIMAKNRSEGGLVFLFTLKK